MKMKYIKSIFIDGAIPSLKNSKRIVRGKNGKPIIIKSQAAMDFFDRHIKYLSTIPCIHENNLFIEILFTPQDRRSKDLDNVATTILDLLVLANIIKDDNFNVVSELNIKVNMDRIRPGAFIKIWEKENGAK